MGVTSVVLMAFGATAALATPGPTNPPAPTGSITTNANGSVTVDVSGTWSWAVGTAKGDINATSKQQCASHYGIGWAMVWNDSTDPGYPITYKHGVKSYTESVGDSATSDDSVHFASPACGTYNSGAQTVSGPWTGTHTYSTAASLPTSGQVCVVSYVLKSTHKKQLLYTNRKNSFRAAVKADHGATWATSPNCVALSSLVASPTIVTTATNASLGSAITDTATLSGMSPDVAPGPVVSNQDGTVVFKAYGPNTSGCTSTPAFTSTAIAGTGTGNGTYGPVSFTPTKAGDYRWVATYSGSANNNGATELCGAAGETSSVSATGTGGNSGTGSSGSGSSGTGSSGSSGTGSTGSGTSGTSGSSGTTSTNPSTSTSASVPAVATSATSPTTGSTDPTAISGATTVHTGEPWAGSKPFVVAVVALGLSLMGLGYFERRRVAVRPTAEDGVPSTD